MFGMSPIVHGLLKELEEAQAELDRARAKRNDLIWDAKASRIPISQIARAIGMGYDSFRMRLTRGHYDQTVATTYHPTRRRS